MSTPEDKVKQYIDRTMKKWFPNAVKYSPPGLGRFGKNGMPDRIWWIRANEDVGITICIEAKAPGKQATSLQLKTLMELRTQGCIVAIVVGKDIGKMEKIHAEVFRRIRLANEKPGASAI